MTDDNMSAPIPGQAPANLAAERSLFGGAPVIEFADENRRRSFLKAAMVVGFGSTLVAASRTDTVALAAATAKDLEILNYALTLEYLESDFYRRGLQAKILSGRTLELVEPISNHEDEHVTTLTSVVNDAGGKTAARPKFTYPAGTFKSRDAFLKTASIFEELGVTAYHGQVARIDSGAYLAAAASIAGVESRHAAIVADLIDGNPFPASFEKQASMSTVLKAAGQFIDS